MAADPTVLGLPWLYNLIKTRFDAEGPPNTNFAFGWKESFRKSLKSPRIVFEPGPIKPDYVRGPGGAPRRLSTSIETCTVYLWDLPAATPAVPATETTPAIPAVKAALEDELAQYTATRYLYDLFARAILLDAHGVVRIDSVDWIKPDLERKQGVELKVKITLEANVLDLAWSGDLGAEVDGVVAESTFDIDNIEITFPADEPDEPDPDDPEA